VTHNEVLLHAAWFVSGNYPWDWSFALQPLSLAYLTAAVALAGLVRVAGRILGEGIEISWLARLAPYMPFCVRIHVAGALIMLASLGMYLTPAMRLHANLGGYLLGALSVVIAVLMAAGWYTRVAAWLLILSGPLGVLGFGLAPVLGRIDLLGAGVFLLFTGGGHWSADWELGRTRDFTFHDAARGIWALRIGAGLALVFAGFSEKLANPAIASAFLHLYPRFNVIADLGIPLSALEFSRLMGGMEVLLGLLLISGSIPQVVMVAAALPFIATLLMFGTVELAGHLPAHAALIAFLVFGSHPVLRPTVWALWPWSASGKMFGAPAHVPRAHRVVKGSHDRIPAAAHD
jgi:hypothetical protein